ncbi:MAG: FtsX-like permease family protein [Clostridia bacterium]|nr:FtsX-like permease family protein [Clostridia bacterium]
MKRTQLKDALRNIWKQKVSFLSIVVIAALGVTMFLGIDFSASAIFQNATAFYNEKNYRDVELVSTLLLSEGDLEAIRSTDGVRDVESVFLTSAQASVNDARMNVDVVSLTERINQPILYEGRLPETETECAIESKLADALGLHTGDSVAITDASGNAPQYLTEREYIVSGVIVHPDHVCSSVPITPYVVVVPDAFDAETLNGCCMKAEVVTDRASDAARFDGAYLRSVGAVLTHLDALGTTRAAVREAEVHTQAEDMLADYRGQIADAEQELVDARAELDQGHADLKDGEAQYADGEQKLVDARAELDDARQQLQEGEQELSDARAELDEAKEQLDAGKTELDAAKKQLDSAYWKLVSGWNTIEDAKTQIRGKLKSALDDLIGEDSSRWIAWASPTGANPNSSESTAGDFRITDSLKVTLGASLSGKIGSILTSVSIPDDVLQKVYAQLGGEGEYDSDAALQLLSDRLASIAGEYQEDYDALADGCTQWDAGHQQYLNGLRQYRAALAQYNEGLAAYEEGEAQYAEGLRQYEEGLKAYQDGEAQYAQGILDLEQARKELDEAHIKLDDGERQYAEGFEQLIDGKAKLTEAEEQVASLGPCKWIALDAAGNASFTQVETAGSNLKSMEMTFSLLFVLVGALVIYATISKMVDEQRSLVGTTKALGFFNREIFAKYLMFGVTATVLGTILGLVLAATFIQGFALNGYDRYFEIDLLPHAVKLLPTVLAFAASILLAVAAIWFAAKNLLRESAIRLMQQAVPKGTKKGSALKKTLLSLYSRLILLNIRTDLRRVLVTVVSVAGCCALVVIGVTLRQAVTGAEEKQFNGIIRHDGMVWFDPETDAGTAEAIEERIAKEGADSVPVMHAYVTVQIKNTDLQELYCGDLSAISEMYALTDAKTGLPITPSDEGIYVTKRFSEIYGIKTGDTFTLALNGTETVEVRVAGVFDCYMNRYLFMSGSCFRSLFGREIEPNAFFVRLNGTDSVKLCESLRSVDGFMSYEAADTTRTLFRSATAVLNGIVLLFVGMAGIMAGVVLMNLTNIYIMQKKRELTIMRVNGFTVKEVIGYVLRETYVTTAIGILLGIGLGAGIGYRIVRSLEQSYIQFDRSVSLLACLTGAAITIVFAVIVNAIALRKVKKLKLTDLS